MMANFDNEKYAEASEEEKAEGKKQEQPHQCSDCDYPKESDKSNSELMMKVVNDLEVAVPTNSSTNDGYGDDAAPLAAAAAVATSTSAIDTYTYANTNTPATTTTADCITTTNTPTYYTDINVTNIISSDDSSDSYLDTRSNKSAGGVFVNVSRSNVTYPQRQQSYAYAQEQETSLTTDASDSNKNMNANMNANANTNTNKNIASGTNIICGNRNSVSGSVLDSSFSVGRVPSQSLANEQSDDVAILAEAEDSISSGSISSSIRVLSPSPVPTQYSSSSSSSSSPSHHKLLQSKNDDDYDTDAADCGKNKSKIIMSDHRQHSSHSSSISSAYPKNKEKEEAVSFSYRHQIIAALAANLGSMALGATMSYTSTALPDLRKSNEFGQISTFQETWIGSITLLGAVFSCPVAGFALEMLGRRRTMLFLTLPFLLGWVSIFFAQSLTMIYVGRFVCGFTSGSFSIAAPVYITENSSPQIRGMLTSGFDMLITVGILYIFVVGTFASWRYQAFFCALIPMAFHLMMTFVPESPRFLVEKGKDDEAREALAWLKCQKTRKQPVENRADSNVNDDDDRDSCLKLVDQELADLKKSVSESRERTRTWRDLLTIPVIKPMSIALALMFFQQLSGMDAVMLYTVDIFHSSGSDIDDNVSAIIVGAIQVCATVFAALTVDHCGRRLLFLLSGIFMVISLGAMGAYFYLKQINDGNPPANLQWLPLSSLMVYVVAFSIGFGPLPWLLLGEIIPSHVKGLAAGIVTITRWILGFIVTLMFHDIMALGEHIGYWFFASMCFLSIIFVYFFLPETKGMTLDEVALFFNCPSEKTNQDHEKGSNCSVAQKNPKS